MLLRPDKTGDKCESRERVLMGLDSADTHHTANSFAVDPGGAVYFQEGTFHHTSVETPWGPPVRNVNAGVYRFEPRTFKFETYIAFNFANPHGHAFDRWGRDIVVDGTGSQPYDAALFSGHMDYPMKHASPPQVYQQRTRPCPGIEFLSSRHFPESWQQNLLVANVIGFQGILRYRIDDDGASFVGVEQEPLLSSSDPNFRPSDLKIGPDGALYFLDWHNPIIGHMQHNLRDPSRDREHGRIYRVTCEGRPLLKDPPISGQPIEKLLELLKWPEDRVRARVRQELANRSPDKVVEVESKLEFSTDFQNYTAEQSHLLLERLWLAQSQDLGNEYWDGVWHALQIPEPRARASIVRLMCNSRDRIPRKMLVQAMRELARDEHPRVRLEAVRAASFFTEPEAFEICLIAAEKPTDKYLDFVQQETRKTLEPIVRQALAAGKPDWFTTDAGHRWYVKNVDSATLAKLPRNRQIALELLTRAGMSDEIRKSAAVDLAKFDGTSEPKALLTALQLLGEESRTDNSVVYDLVRLLTFRADSELSAVRPDLENLALKSKSPIARQLGYVALIAADKGTDRSWNLAESSTDALRDLLEAVPMIRDLSVRASLFPKIEPLIRASTSPRVLRSALAALVAMPGREAGAFGAAAKLLSSPADRNMAVQALKRIPPNTWPAGETKPVLDALISWIRSAPADERTSTEMLDVFQLADALSLTLPPDQARIARRTLGELGVRVLRVGTKFEQMLFDQDRLVVQAGKRVEIVFENLDLMPHNFVILEPGSLDEIGALAEAAVTDPQAAAREYVPQSKKVLLASKLAQPRTSQKLAFDAPMAPGVYPYVCTYPGHWRRMYGALYVVADLEDYLADAEGYLAKHPLTAVDPLLKSNRPRKEWTLDELADALPHLGEGRSFAAGQQLFQSASCISCHKVGNLGHEIGPDLTKLDVKKTPKEILFDILEPSAKIDEKYQSWRIETTAGKIITGLIIGETPDAVKLIENPLASATPIEIKKSGIASRERVATSIMPKGLLDKLTKEEILDLLAFVVARGDAKSGIYSGGHSHGH
jgi:putative heme-binding domain-containing protein